MHSDLENYFYHDLFSMKYDFVATIRYKIPQDSKIKEYAITVCPDSNSKF